MRNPSDSSGNSVDLEKDSSKVDSLSTTEYNLLSTSGDLCRDIVIIAKSRHVVPRPFPLLFNDVISCSTVFTMSFCNLAPKIVPVPLLNSRDNIAIESG